jgi:putative membrane protein
MIRFTDVTAGLLALLLGLLFGLGVRRARANHRPLPQHTGRRATIFGSGTLVLFLAFTFPADSVLPEMIEHILLAFAVPPLLLLGVPRQVLLPIFAYRRSRRVVQALTRPSRAIIVFLVVLFACYVPHVFNATMASDGLRFALGLAILFAAVLFWWPVIEPFPSWDRELAELGKLLYLFIGSSVLKGLGFILAIVPRPIYAVPPGSRPLWGLSALNDQQYAGWLMVGAGTFVLLAAATVVCAQLLHEPDETSGTPPSPGRGSNAGSLGNPLDPGWPDGPDAEAG